MNILFITYYFPPCNSIASNRTQSFYISLIDAKHDVTVVTRAWTGSENTWNDYVASSETTFVKKQVEGKGTIYYLPYKEIVVNRSGNLQRKTKTTFNFFKGEFNKEIDATSFYSFCDELLQTGKFDAILISSPPINSVKLGYLLKQKYPHVKLMMDFRDLQNHILCAKNPIINFTQKVEHYFITKYFKKWLKQANEIFVASYPFQDYLKQIGFESHVLLNGFEEKIFKSETPIESNTKKFSITVLGTIYPHQELDFFIATLKGFVINKSIEKVNINLIGIKAIPEVADKLSKALYPFCSVTSKISREEALNIGRESSVLAYPGWKGYKGMYSGKLFEYLALKKHILIAPTDNDVIEKIVNECEAGMCVNTIEEGINYLNDLYKQWFNNDLVLHSNANKIEAYSREEQNKILLNRI